MFTTSSNVTCTFSEVGRGGGYCWAQGERYNGDFIEHIGCNVKLFMSHLDPQTMLATPTIITIVDYIFYASDELL